MMLLYIKLGVLLKSFQKSDITPTAVYCLTEINSYSICETE